MELSVKDTGPGIPADRLDRLFRAFSQVDASTTRNHGGTGLGLAIAQRLTELMGGWIDVVTAEGKGAEFRVGLPVERCPLPEGGEAGPALETGGRPVLVALTAASQRRAVSRLLESLGLNVREVTRPEEARDLARVAVAAVVDRRFWTDDGFELAARWGLPAVVLSPGGAELSEALARSAGQGTVTCLGKPATREGLRRALGRVLLGEEEPAPGRTPERAPVRELRILLAEDNVVNQRVAAKLLERMGYRAEVAQNGEEAVTAVRRGGYDLVLMDVQMPVMDGLEATAQILALGDAVRRPMIVGLSANAMGHHRQQALEAGMDDYLSKPMELAALEAVLEKASARRVKEGEEGARGMVKERRFRLES